MNETELQHTAAESSRLTERFWIAKRSEAIGKGEKTEPLPHASGVTQTHSEEKRSSAPARRTRPQQPLSRAGIFPAEHDKAKSHCVLTSAHRCGVNHVGTSAERNILMVWSKIISTRK